MSEVPLISYTQKLVLYETKARYYIVGSNKTETKFRVLKIDRTEPKELVVHDDKVEYSKGEIRNILTMINDGNQPRSSQRGSGLTKTVSAFGIVGFIRFLEGYYIILITKRRKVALLGSHTIYKVEDTSMLYIPNDTVRYFHPDESRYVRMFQNVDLSSNFYFSYSYDLTHSLQYNMTRSINADQPTDLSQSEKGPTDSWQDRSDLKPPVPAVITDASLQLLNSENGLQEFCSMNRSPSISPSNVYQTSNLERDKITYGTRNRPFKKFVWNIHLLKKFDTVVHHEWIIYIIHGFFGQSKICVYGKPVYLTLIGRRSNQFAGTRFLKRGANSEGAVANHIETEQIVHDASVTFLPHAKVTSFTQMRGSIPLCWSQDTSKMVPKPPITLDQRDPYAHIAGQHFNELLSRYGAPVIVLNLIKTREKKKHEGILSGEFIESIRYLNQFLPPEHNMQYIGFDMARLNKRKDSNVLVRLAKIAKYCVKQTGFFLHMPSGQADVVLKDEELKSFKGMRTLNGCCQIGVVRTNCVDCLDRTNTAQFALGKCVLSYQLYALGVIERPHLEFDTDCIRMLEDLYEDHGDTIALQYGGSQLVHRIKGYKKIAPWTSHSRDIMQTLSRYYSNAFSDVEKQQAFNLFLGVYEPKEGQLNLWELPTDYYLHNKNAMGIKPLVKRSYSQWWDLPVCRSLPLSYDEDSKCADSQMVVVTTNNSNENVNAFYEYYRPFELTVFEELYSMSMTSSIRDFMPKSATDSSPFILRRTQLSTHLEKSGVATFHRTHSCTNLSFSTRQESSTNWSGKESVASQGSEGSTSSTDESDVEGGVNLSDTSSPYDSDHVSSYISFQELFPSMKTVYDTDITDLNKRDLKLYERYVEIEQCSKENYIKDESTEKQTLQKKSLGLDFGVPCKHQKVSQGVDIYPMSGFKMDSMYCVEPPPVSRQAKDIYSSYIVHGMYGAGPPSKADLQTYAKYVSSKYR